MCVYFPPHGSAYTHRFDILDCIEAEMCYYKTWKILLCRDFNSRAPEEPNFNTQDDIHFTPLFDNLRIIQLKKNIYCLIFDIRDNCKILSSACLSF